jgi:transposase
VYSQDLRDGVLAGEGSIREVADRLSVSPSYVSKATSRFRLTGQRTAKPRGGQRQAILAGREELLRERLEAVKDTTLDELRSWLRQEHDIKISIGALWNSWSGWACASKKSAHATEQERLDVQAEREAWREAQPELDASALVFLDET